MLTLNLFWRLAGFGVCNFLHFLYCPSCHHGIGQSISDPSACWHCWFCALWTCLGNRADEVRPFHKLNPKELFSKKSPEPKMKKDLELRRPRHRRHTQGVVEPVQTSLFIFLFRLIKFCKRNFFWFLIRLTLSLTTILHLSPRHRPVSVSV